MDKIDIEKYKKRYLEYMIHLPLEALLSEIDIVLHDDNIEHLMKDWKIMHLKIESTKRLHDAVLLVELDQLVKDMNIYLKERINKHDKL
jgi:hypothetical protein